MVKSCFYAHLCFIKLAVPMKKAIILMALVLFTTGAAAQSSSAGDVLAAAQLANKYFMDKCMKESHKHKCPSLPLYGKQG